MTPMLRGRVETISAQAAEPQRKTDAGILGVVGGRRFAQFGRENLRAVLNGSVGQRAHLRAWVRKTAPRGRAGAVEFLMASGVLRWYAMCSITTRASRERWQLSREDEAAILKTR